jgi:hypothetical protein
MVPSFYPVDNLDGQHSCPIESMRAMSDGSSGSQGDRDKHGLCNLGI